MRLGVFALKFLNAIREDRTPNLLLMRYALATWEVRDLLLIPSFMFSESAVIKRPSLSSTARRAGWVGYNFALNRVPAEARIAIVTDSHIKDKIRQQLQVLRDWGLLIHLGRGEWRLP